MNSFIALRTLESYSLDLKQQKSFSILYFRAGNQQKMFVYRTNATLGSKALLLNEKNKKLDHQKSERSLSHMKNTLSSAVTPVGLFWLISSS